ncbi:MAG: hypothetical protein A2488_01940 [Candidatus Magasanikbacteria bacterium RIFOXYC12_FULL_32_21b]|nr:MAG: hypothetical protein A2488_01940 [Candidatus Magasanikbacteria bacterium RIFOXYC12_FULL_32_21b]
MVNSTLVAGAADQVRRSDRDRERVLRRVLDNTRRGERAEVPRGRGPPELVESTGRALHAEPGKGDRLTHPGITRQPIAAGAASASTAVVPALLVGALRDADRDVAADAGDTGVGRAGDVVIAVSRDTALGRHAGTLDAGLTFRAVSVGALVGLAVAVVVVAVTELDRAGMERSITLEAILGGNVAISVVVACAGIWQLRDEHLWNTVPVAIRVADVAQAVLVDIGLVRVSECWAVVSGVGLAVAVKVRVAGVADVVAVRVLLIRVGDHRAVVSGVGLAVAIEVRIASVADPVDIRVLLIRVGDHRAVVGGVGLAVAIEVVGTSVADPVAIRVLLVGIGCELAVVNAVKDPIVVVVGINAVGLAVVVVVVEALVDAAVAVVVHAVAHLPSFMMNARDERLTIRHVGVAVVVVVVIALVAGAIEVTVGLSRALTNESLRPTEAVDITLMNTEQGGQSPREQSRSDVEAVVPCLA